MYVCNTFGTAVLSYEKRQTAVSEVFFTPVGMIWEHELKSGDSAVHLHF